MSSSSDDDDASPDNNEVANNRLLDNIQRESANGADSDAESFSRTRSPNLFESGTITPTPELNGTSFQGYGRVKKAEEEDSVDSSELAPLDESWSVSRWQVQGRDLSKRWKRRMILLR